MVDKRNRIVDLIEYIESLGISVNVGKTKARGNNGVFMHRGNKFRIDVSKNLPEENILSVLLHEFAHYIHYTHDKDLKSLNFVFSNFDDDILEELIGITVKRLPKEFALSLFNIKKELSDEIKIIAKSIKEQYPDFKLSEQYKPIEKMLNFPLNYLFKYDKIKVFTKTYTLDDIKNDLKYNDILVKYIKLKSKQRQLSRINSKITRLNKYYNNNSELFARFFESYFLEPELTSQKAPTAYNMLKNSSEKIIKNIENIMFCKKI